VVPEGAREFFVASTGASATLIGLLFVAIAVEPRSIVGEESPVELRSRASSAFVALLNVFFVSLGGTVPPINVGVVAAILAVVGIVDTLGIGLSLLEERSAVEAGRSSAVLLVVSLIIYALELWYAWRVSVDQSNPEALYALVNVLFVVYGVALGRAWELLGARDQGFFRSLLRNLYLLRQKRRGGRQNPGGRDQDDDGEKG
jgi:multidrug transporter EmrE-like cation transporter